MLYYNEILQSCATPVLRMTSQILRSFASLRMTELFQDDFRIGVF